MRSVYLQDWLSDPRVADDLAAAQGNAPVRGALGDLGAHIVDAAQFVTGERITGVSALTNTFVQRAAVPRSGGTERR